MQGNWKNWRNSYWWSANREKFRENDLKRSLETQNFSRENVEIFGGARTETKCVKWSASRKRLRSAALEYVLPVCCVLYSTSYPGVAYSRVHSTWVWTRIMSRAHVALLCWRHFVLRSFDG